MNQKSKNLRQYRNFYVLLFYLLCLPFSALSQEFYLGAKMGFHSNHINYEVRAYMILTIYFLFHLPRFWM